MGTPRGHKYLVKSEGSASAAELVQGKFTLRGETQAVRGSPLLIHAEPGDALVSDRRGYKPRGFNIKEGHHTICGSEQHAKQVT